MYSERRSNNWGRGIMSTVMMSNYSHIVIFNWEAIHEYTGVGESGEMLGAQAMISKRTVWFISLHLFFICW